jgi:hypothetical protein
MADPFKMRESLSNIRSKGVSQGLKATYAPNAVDPEAEARKQMQAQAKNYRANMGQAREGMYNLAEGQGRQALAQRMGQITQQANQRGLLYSGLRQGAQAGAQGEIAGQLANERARINQATEARAQEMENAAIGVGLQARNQAIQAQDDAYNLALQKKKQEMDLAKGLGGVAGQAIGTGTAYLGRGK